MSLIQLILKRKTKKKAIVNGDSGQERGMRIDEDGRPSHRGSHKIQVQKYHRLYLTRSKNKKRVLGLQKERSKKGEGTNRRDDGGHYE